MNLNTERTNSPQMSALAFPLYVFNEFWHVLYVGFAVTFGPDQAPVGKRQHSPNHDALQLKLVLNKNGKELAPLMLEFPNDTFEARSLAAEIADAIAEKVAARNISARLESSAASN
jgi:hypothetical protein